MFKPFTFSSFEAKKLFENSKTLLRIPGLKLITERKSKTEAPQETEQTISTEPAGKLLIVIPGRVGNSVRRNLIRRRIKSIYYELKLSTFPRKMAIFLYKEAKDLSYDDFLSFFSKIRIPDISSGTK